MNTRIIHQLNVYWKTKGGLATVRAIGRTLLGFLIRHRCRLVYEAPLTAPREPSIWGPHEKLLVFGPDNIDELSPELLATMEAERHAEDLQSVHDGNRLFVVAYESYCLHRAYVCTVDRPPLRHDRNAIFFGELSDVPMIRGSETTRYAGQKGISKYVVRGLYARVLNEQLRYLQSAGYKRAVLFIMAENTMSIKGVTAAGFQLSRVLNDWIVFESFIFQKIYEKGTRKWRVLVQ